MSAAGSGRRRSGTGTKDDPLYGIRRLLLQARETLSDKGRSRLEVGLAGDPQRRCALAWLAKTSLRDAYAATSRAEVARLFDDFLAECHALRIPELHRLAGTLTKWRKEIVVHTPPALRTARPRP
jgi:transposase